MQERDISLLLMLNLAFEDDRLFQVKGAWKGLLNTWQYWPPEQWPSLCVKKNNWTDLMSFLFVVCGYNHNFKNGTLILTTCTCMLDWPTVEETSTETTYTLALKAVHWLWQSTQCWRHLVNWQGQESPTMTKWLDWLLWLRGNQKK